jgi:hypothetical protein
VAAGTHPYLAPIGLIVGADQERRPEQVVAIDDDVGTDRQPIPDHSLGWIAAAVEFGLDPLDDDRPSGADRVRTWLDGGSQAAKAGSGSRHAGSNPT